MQQGINLLVDAISPTLGPLPRHVAVERMQRGQPPELLDKGALIARRVTGLPDADAEMGALLLRQMLWQQYELYGDGTATAAIVFQSLFNEGVKYVTAGGSAMRLRTCLFEALQRILSCLAQQKSSVQGREQIRQVAQTLSQDATTAEILSEVFDTLGEYGRVDIRSGHGRTLEREYLHGIYWASGIQSQELITDKIANKTDLERCAVFVSDFEFDDPRTLLPIITAAAQARALVIIASKLSERAVSLLTHINKTPQRFQAIAVKVPTDHAARIRMLEDVARITGARLVLQAAQEDIQRIQAQDLGFAAQVWANQDYFCIVEDADGGERRAAYLAELHQRLQNKALEDEQRTLLRERIGQLQGASATLLVGGVGQSDIDERKAKLKEIVSALRSSLEQGIIPGGGIALLNCQSALRKHLDSDDTDERAAYRMLARALEMPLRHILSNAGYEAGEVLARIQNEPGGYGFDVTAGQIRPMLAAGVVDSAGVVAAALERAVRTAALALTVDVLVHRRTPEFAANP
ncbi:MAG: hypothetical protein JNJ61_00990 [Anaerolineae bacterium]|nr:hypothetical protein [Anaerolineae bacterium]